MSTLKKDLDLIQQLMTSHFIQRLQSGDVSPSELSTIRQYLRDNNVVVAPDKAAELGTLGVLLPEFTDEVEVNDETTFN